MPNYATIDDLKSRFFDDVEILAGLTSGGSNLSVDNDVITAVLEDSEAEVDSYLACRISVPFDTSVDPVFASRLSGLSLDIGQFRLASRGHHVSEDTIRLRDQAIVWLVAFCDGTIDPPTAVMPASPSGTVKVGSDPQVFVGNWVNRL